MYGYITKMNDFVLRTDGLIPQLHHRSVHLVSGIPGAQLVAVLDRELADSLVSPVGIGGYESTHDESIQKIEVLAIGLDRFI